MKFSTLLANTLLVVHFAFIAFVIFGFLLTVIGYFRRWSWIINFWFRFLHLCAILLVVLQAWLGAICPLTVWESELREATMDAGYSEPFVAHWLQRVIYYDLPLWLFTVAYTVFAALAVLTWIFIPPKRVKNNEENSGNRNQ